MGAQPQGGEQPGAVTPARPTEKSPKADPAESLPKWARELLEQNGVTNITEQAAAFSGGGTPGSRVTWSAPGAGTTVSPVKPSSYTGPADMVLKEKPVDEEEQTGQPSISEAELQRTADRVYRIIEERLRRELRRSGR